MKKNKPLSWKYYNADAKDNFDKIDEAKYIYFLENQFKKGGEHKKEDRKQIFGKEID